MLQPGEDLRPDMDATAKTANAETGNKMTRIIRNRAVHALAMWAFMYTGTEVSLGGSVRRLAVSLQEGADRGVQLDSWIVTFLQEERGGGASSGYASTGTFKLRDSITTMNELTRCSRLLGRIDGWQALFHPAQLDGMYRAQEDESSRRYP